MRPTGDSRGRLPGQGEVAWLQNQLAALHLDPMDSGCVVHGALASSSEAEHAERSRKADTRGRPQSVTGLPSPPATAAPSTAQQLLASALRMHRAGQPLDAVLTAQQALELCLAPAAGPLPKDEALACRLWCLMISCLEELGLLRTAYTLAVKSRQYMKDNGRREQLAAVALKLLGSIAVRGLIEPQVQAPCGSFRATSPKTCVGTAPLDPGPHEPLVRRILCLSDLHVDQAGGRNLAALKSMSRSNFLNDILIVAGDIGDTFEALRVALQVLRPCFHRVVLVPGNHDLWIRPGTPDAALFPDSFCKLWAILDLCTQLGVDTQPVSLPLPLQVRLADKDQGHVHRCDAGSRAASVWIVPLLSWYNASFDQSDPRPGRLQFDAFCKWPVSDLDVWQVMLRINSCSISRVQDQLRSQPEAAAVITVSHFLPHPSLPFSSIQPEMAKAVGCHELQVQLAQVQSNVHVYGHTHINADLQLDKEHGSFPCGSTISGSRRYIHNALDGHARNPTLICVWDGRKMAKHTICFDGRQAT